MAGLDAISSEKGDLAAAADTWPDGSLFRFVDRAYEGDGTLQSRSIAGSVLTDPADAVRQALSFIKNGGVTAVDGTFLKIAVDTLCVHGDTPGAPEIARAVRDAFAKAKVKVTPFRS